MQAQWFEVDLNTLQLVPTERSDWPDDMRSDKRRILEEHLETLVAYNLDLLFPKERLLLVKTQFRISPEADVVAIDPLGVTRIMELKITPVRFDEVWSQALAYGIRAIAEAPDSWQGELGESLPHLPETLGLMAEAMRIRARTTALGKKWIDKQDVQLAKPYARHNFHERLDLLIGTLRKMRGVHDSAMGASDPVAAAAIQRAYGPAVDTANLDDPSHAVRQILDHWGGRQARSGAEITVIAPGVNTEENLVQLRRIEERHVGFHLIDADLRWDGNAPNPRVLLRWKPEYRTTPSPHHQFAIRVRDELANRNPAAANFDWSYVKSPKRRITWGHQRRIFATTDHEKNELTTGAEWLVDGIAHLKEKRERLMADLGRRLAESGCHVRGREIVAPWGEGATEPAVQLLDAYHDLVVDDLFYGRFEPFKRPDQP